jgi:hypothetical protein
VASAVVLTAMAASAARRATGIPARTTRRWLRWWRGPFTASAPFAELSARLVPAPERKRLPLALLERFEAVEAAAPVAKLLAWLAPLTTSSSPDGSRWVRAVM